MNALEGGNQTGIAEFILLGLTNNQGMQTPLFFFFLMVYLITVLDNIGIIFICYLDPHLHTPMYYFISNLSFADLCYSSTITPKMITGFLVERNVISKHGCALQLYFFSTFCIAEFILISVMAFDRYTAICKPLHYTTIMTKKLCNQLVAGPYVSGLLSGVVYIIVTFKLSYCDNMIPHYFCDMLPLFRLSCEDTWFSQMIVFIIVACFGSCNILGLMVSYSCIIIGILRIRSSRGRQRVFSTCSAHFVSVALFYGTGLYMYLRPNARHSDEKDNVISVFYTIIIPMLNPIIYSFRNKDVKAAVGRSLRIKQTFCDG